MLAGPDPAREIGDGRVGDGPWGKTLASFALRRSSGELVVTADDGKQYRIAFTDGVVVAASSPLAADSVARIALTSHLVSSTQVAAISKRVAAASDRDEIEVVAETARLSVEHAVRLRKRVITQRAARTFSVDRGAYRFGDPISLPVISGIDVDIRAAIYLGVHLNLSESRLAEDIRKLGSRFTLDPNADLTCFGFTDVEEPIIESLRAGASIHELDARHRDIVPRTAQAIVYALVSCGACTVTAATTEAPVRTSSITELESRVKTTTWKAPLREASEPTRTTELGARTKAQSEAPVISRTITPRRNAFAVRETIAQGLALVDAGADHFTLLGVSADAPLDVIRSAYVGLACQLHRDKLPLVDEETAHAAHRLFASVNAAFGILCDPARRAEYAASLRQRAGEPVRTVRPTDRIPAPASDGLADRRIDKAILADEAFRRGLLALKREDLPSAIEELMRATELSPHDVDHAAMLAWARFCAASDKHAVASEIRRVLHTAVLKSPKPMTAQFYLGRVERILGRVHEALHHFREVLEIEPGHVDAATEIRMLEPRAANDRRGRR